MFRNRAPLLLASQSPRRRQLLEQLGIRFRLVPAEIEEFEEPGESPAGFVRRMAREKACAAAGRNPDGWILAADTIVVKDNVIIGKPENPQMAVRMLTELCGGWHRVMTAFTLKNQVLDYEYTELDSSRVRLAELDGAAISAYIAGGEPLDKAGSYAVQGVGGAFVESIEGCPTTVIGLPLPQVVRRLLECGIIAAASAQS